MHIAGNELSIEVGKSKEASNSFYVLWLRPLQNGLDLRVTHANTVFSHDHAKKFNFFGLECALLRFDEEIVLLKMEEYFQHNLIVFFLGVELCENHEIVDVDNVDILHISEDLIHHRLEYPRGIAESKEHY